MHIKKWLIDYRIRKLQERINLYTNRLNEIDSHEVAHYREAYKVYQDLVQAIADHVAAERERFARHINDMHETLEQVKAKS